MSLVEKEQSGTSDGDVFPSITINNFGFHNQSWVRNHSKRHESSRFKGVIRHNNGHWGAQIYVKSKKVWLGTFKSEKETAMAYDSASIKLRNGDAHRNFPLTSITVHEPQFQRQYDVGTFLVMIKDGSYMNKFSEYLNPEVGVMGQELFQKELTPSDVGRFNRLVIPRKFAVKYFPPIPQNMREQDGEFISGVQDIDLYFYDRSRRSWKFRYCFWKSIQCFMFTRGWNIFVKENLRAKDMVVFSFLENIYMIDIRYSDTRRNNVVVEDAPGLGEVEVNKDKGISLFGVQIE